MRPSLHCSRYRQGEYEGAAVAKFAFGVNRSSMGAHDVFGDGQAQTGAP